MITALVFIHAEVARLSAVAEQIAQVPGVSEVYSVTGDLDLVAIVRVRDVDDIARTVTDGINTVDGVTSTQTQIAYRAFSRHDLDAAFSLGL